MLKRKVLISRSRHSDDLDARFLVAEKPAARADILRKRSRQSEFVTRAFAMR